MQREEAAVDRASATCPKGGKTGNVGGTGVSVGAYKKRDTHAACTASASVLACGRWYMLVCVCTCLCVSDARVQSKEARQCVRAAGEGIQPAQATCH